MSEKENLNNDESTLKLVKKISMNIRSIRERHGLTQVEMANHGFGSRWYQRLESGRHIPTIPTLNKLATAFKVDIVEFFK